MTFNFLQAAKRLFCDCFKASHKWASVMFYLFHSCQGSSEFIKLRLQDAWTCPGQLFTLSSQECFPSLISSTSWSCVIISSHQAQAIHFYGLTNIHSWVLHRPCQQSIWLLQGMSISLQNSKWKHSWEVFVEVLLSVPCPRNWYWWVWGIQARLLCLSEAALKCGYHPPFSIWLSCFKCVLFRSCLDFCCFWWTQTGTSEGLWQVSGNQTCDYTGILARRCSPFQLLNLDEMSTDTKGGIHLLLLIFVGVWANPV